MTPTLNPSVESRAAKVIREVFESGRPVTYIRSSEEQRVGSVLREVGHAMPSPLPVWTWTLTEGLRRDGAAAEPGTQSPRGVLDFISSYSGEAIFHLKDFHDPLRESSEIRRRLRDVYESGQDRRKFVVISSPVRFIPEELERSVVFLELRPPDIVELTAFLRDELERNSAAGGKAHASEDLLQQLAIALQGLTLDEVRYALRRALAVNPQLGPESIPAVLEEKRLLINRSGTIEFISTPTRLDQVGGLEGLKKWLLERRKLFQMRDSLDTEIVPKGILHDGNSGLRKELVREGHGRAFRASALSRRYDRDFLGTARQVRKARSSRPAK